VFGIKKFSIVFILFSFIDYKTILFMYT
jgi:hypothetical protein